MRLVYDIIKGMIFKKSDLELVGLDKFDLRKVPAEKAIAKMLKVVKKRYPNFYKVMITERNKVMAQRLFLLQSQNPEKLILAVVGAGHEKELIDLVKQHHADSEYETIVF